MILKFKKIIDLDKGIVEVDDEEIINVTNKQLEEPKKDYEILSTHEGLCNCINRLKQLVKSKLK